MAGYFSKRKACYLPDMERDGILDNTGKSSTIQVRYPLAASPSEQNREKLYITELGYRNAFPRWHHCCGQRAGCRAIRPHCTYPDGCLWAFRGRGLGLGMAQRVKAKAVNELKEALGAIPPILPQM